MISYDTFMQNTITIKKLQYATCTDGAKATTAHRSGVIVKLHREALASTFLLSSFLLSLATNILISVGLIKK